MGTLSTGTLPIDNLINTGTSSTSSTTSASASASESAAINAQLGPGAFLQLLTTQLQNQDPSSPVDDTQSITQLAQFSETQSVENLQNSFSQFQSNFGSIQAASLLGSTVTVTDPNAATTNGTISGVVSGVSIVNGSPMLSLTNSSGTAISGTFATSSITAIQ